MTGLVMMLVAFLLFAFLPFRFRWRAEVGLPVFLCAGRKLVQVSEEHSYFPHVIAAECLVPGRHARVTDASADSVEDVPIGVVWRIGSEIRWGGIKGRCEKRRFAIKGSVAKSAIHGIELHAIFQVLISRHERVADTGCVALC